MTNFFVESIYENVFIVSAQGKLVREIQQPAWRSFLATDADTESPIADLLFHFDLCALASRLNHESSGINSRRFARISIVLDEGGRVVQTHPLERELSALRASGLIMAGGFGRRLGEMTKATPKPMLRVCGKPIAEHIVEAMVDNGITDIYFSIFHLGGVVKEHFGDGSKLGCRIRYIEETIPLGTAGCLSLIEEPLAGPLLMVNGDVLTNLQFGRILDMHDRLGADLTMSTRQQHMQVHYGVVESIGGYVTHIREKPKIRFDINAAIYVISQHVLEHTTRNRRIDMPELIDTLLPQGLQVATFPLIEDWIDVGSVADFNRALQGYDPGNRPRIDSVTAAPAVQKRVPK
ncbi:MAG: sugar phosphate nucleotidyltransferase [Siculibacillus sp.]|nr:sugar phosphate nucleotidyltransferase [Siculibacillus sp.]